MVELNPFSWEFHENPYPIYRELRDNAPLWRNEELDFYTLARYQDVIDASRDWRTYSSAYGTTVERLDPKLFETQPMMIFMDPPKHDRLRKLVSAAFTPKRVAELEPFIRGLAAQLIDDAAAGDECDFVRDVSAPLPMNVIFTLLGVPEEDRRQVRAWMDMSLDRDPDSPKVPQRAIDAMIEQSAYWWATIAEKRKHPDDRLISALCEVEVEDDAGNRTRLTDGEVAGFCGLLGSAGNETVTKLLANAVVLFSRHPDQYRVLREDRSTIPGAVEEVLRYTSPSQYQGRTVMRDVEWYGETVPEGSRVLLLTGSANRDEREFSDPDRFDVQRPPKQSLGFGFGVHFCIGAPLARLESRVALEEMTARFGRIEVDEARCERVHMSNVHGFASVPMEMVPA